MKTSAWEFRFRLWIGLAIIVLGFWAPWIEWLGLGSRIPHTWGWLALELGRLGLPSGTGFALVSALAIAVTAVAAALRIWGTAYLGAATVFSAEMKAGPERPQNSPLESVPVQAAGQLLADGPYRFMRNPLYAGSFLTILAISTLMPPSGAAVSLPLLAFFILRLILGEEAFLAPRLGDAYDAYRSAVPRLLPSPWPRVPSGNGHPHWGTAWRSEFFPVAVFVSFAALSWRYDPMLLSQAVLVSFGISLIVRALSRTP